MIFLQNTKFNKRAGEVQFWTHENHAVVLDTKEKLQSRLNYIHQNPVRSALVEKEEEYLYSSARNYYGMNSLMEIDLV